MKNNYLLKSLQLENCVVIMLLLLTITGLRAQTAFTPGAPWDYGYYSGGGAGTIVHNNGVVQLLSSVAGGAEAASIHETTSKINTGNSWSICYNVFFGCPGQDNIGSDTKGDGLAWSLYNPLVGSCDPTNAYKLGSSGGGLGYADQACNKIITIEFDTWNSQNLNGSNYDLNYGGTLNPSTGTEDEISLHKDGKANNDGLIFSSNPGNLEDGQQHTVCISYNSGTSLLTVSIDGATRFSYTMGGSDNLEAYFGSGIGLNQMWSSGKQGATNPATVAPSGVNILPNLIGGTTLCPASVTIAAAAAGCSGDYSLSSTVVPPTGCTASQVEFYDGATLVGTDATSPYSVTITPSIGGHNFTAKATFSGACGNQTSSILTTSVSTPSAPTLTSAAGFVNCGQPFGTVSLTGVKAGSTYSAYILGNLATASVAGASNLSLTISTTNLALGANTISITGFVAGCGVTSFGTVLGYNNPAVNTTYSLSNATVCSGSSASLTLSGSQNGVSYFPTISSSPVGAVVVGSGSSIALTVNASTISTPGVYKINVTATTPGCSAVALSNVGSITSNINPTIGVSLAGSTTCGAVSSATVSISGATIGNTYTAYTSLGTVSQVAASSSFALSISTATLSIGNNSVFVTSSVAGCGTATVGSVNIRFNPTITTGLLATSNPICLGSNGTVTISGTQTNVFYYITSTSGSLLSNVATSTGGNLVLTVNSASAPVGTYFLNVTASVPGCAPLGITTGVGYTINQNPIDSITFATAPNCGAVASIPLTVSGVTVGNTYSAYLGSNLLTSQIAVGSSIVLNISTTNLFVGNNSVQVTASVAGCGISTVGSTNIWLNPVVNLTSTSFAGNTVCDPNSGSVTVTSIQPFVTYYPVLGTTTLSGVTSSPITISNLSPGVNIISFLASIKGCSFQNFSHQATIVSNVNNVSGIALTGSTTCGAATTATVSISGTINGNTYAAFLGSTFLASQVAATSPTVLNINTSGLSIGNNSITITSSVAGCGTLTVGSVNILKNPVINNPIGLTGPSLVCNGSTATLTLTGAVPGVTYYPVINSVNGTPVTASSATVLLTTGTLSLGTTTVFVGASVSICPATVFGISFPVVVKPVPNTSLIVTGGNVCQGSSAVVTVSGSEIGVNYTSTTNGNYDPTVFTGTGGDLFLTIQNTNLNLGANIVSVSGTGCLTSILSDTAKVYVNSGTLITTIAGSNSITQCSGSSGTFSATTLLGATYTWSVPSDATINSGQGTANIGVTFGTASGFVSVIPNSALCGAGSSVNQIAINIVNTPTTTNTISGSNIVCANSSLPYSMATVPGATGYLWSAPSGTTITGQNSSSVTILFGTTLGSILVRPYNNCGTFSGISLPFTITPKPEALTVTSFVTSVCSNSTTTLSVTGGLGASSYVWSISGDASISANPTTANPTILFGTTSGAVVFTAYATNNCGTTTSSAFALNISSASGISNGIIAPNILCANNSNSPSGYVFSIPTIAGTNVTYNWGVSQGTYTQASASDPSITLSLPTGTSGSVTASVTVLGLGCGFPSTTTSVAISSLPDISGLTISGATFTCAGVTLPYSIGAGGGASDYVWYNGNTGNSISVTLTSTGVISVKPIGACGTGTGTSLNVTVNTPPTGGNISGPLGVCFDTTGSASNAVPFTANVSNATSYLWAVSTGSSIASGQGNSQAFIIFGKLATTITVTASNLCGPGLPFTTAASVEVDTLSKLAVTTVLGPSIVCNSATSKTFTVVTVPGAVGYKWYYPSTLTVLSSFSPNTLTSPVFGSSITADFASSNVTLTVAAIGKWCSTSKLAYKTIGVTGLVDGIHGSPTPCVSKLDNIYYVTTVPGANGYQWSVGNGTFTTVSALGDSIKVTFTGTGVGKVKVYPMADVACLVGSDSLGTNTFPDLGTGQGIIGLDTACRFQSNDYQSTVSGALFYHWNVPPGASITPYNADSSRIKVTFGSVSGVVMVQAYSPCLQALAEPPVTKPVTVLSYPTADAGGTLDAATGIKTYGPITDEQPISLNGSASSQTTATSGLPKYTYTWTASPSTVFTNGGTLAPGIAPNERETKVYLTVGNGYCSSRDSALVKLDIDLIPKAFSPNGDGTNDTWQIDNLYTYRNFKLTVFNKWGSPVKEFSSYDRDRDRMWDGKSNGVDLPVAVYYYIIDFNGENGKQPRKGTVTIVR